VVERRSRIGDWEPDTVIGKPGGAVLVTLAERKTRQSILALFNPLDVFKQPADEVWAVRQATLDRHYAEHPERHVNGPPQVA